MFIAIISAHYFEYQREAENNSSGIEEEGIFELILSIIRNKVKKKDDDNEDENGKNKDKKDIVKIASEFFKKFFNQIDILD
jgi:hypothetical protein